MRYHVKREGLRWCVVEGSPESPGEVVECFDDEAAARAQLATLEESPSGVVRAADATEAAVAGRNVWTTPVSVAEAVGPDPRAGRRWRIVVIESGISANGNLWSPSVLQTAAPLFAGAEVFEDHDSDRQRGEYPVRRVSEKIGVLESPRYVARPDGTGYVEADLVVIADAWRQNFVNAQEAGYLETFVQFSVNVACSGRDGVVDGRRVTVMDSVDAVRSVDAVTAASAGGRPVHRIESIQPATARGGSNMTPEELRALIASVLDERLAAAGQPAATEAAPPTAAAQPITPVAAAPASDPAPVAQPAAAPAQPITPVAAAAPVAAAEATPAVPDAGAQLAAIQAELATLRAFQAAQAVRTAATEALNASGLPAVAQDRVRQIVEARGAATGWAIQPAEIAATIQAERAYSAAFVQESPSVLGSPAQPGVRVGPDSREMYQARLIGMFSGRPETVVREGVSTQVDPFQSIRQAYHAWNPRTDIWNGGVAFDVMRELQSPFDSRQDSNRVRESITTATWGQVAADALTQVLIREYDAAPYDWRWVVSDIEPVADFRSRHWMAVGGYGDLSTVAESAAYPVLTSPGDEEETYAIAKRGGIEQSITLEMVANDRVGALRRIPTSLSDAAARTLYKFVMGLATTTNPTLGDSVALYHATHGNTGTTALSITALNAVETAMREQTARLNTAEVLGPRNMPAHVIVPNELRALIDRIVNPSAAYTYALSSTPNADQSLNPDAYKGRLTPHVNDYLTDATDWFTVADPTKVPTMVVGFFGGNERPEVFLQDDPNAGTHFANDTRAVKVRHIYGGAILDYRSFYRQVVA